MLYFYYEPQDSTAKIKILGIGGCGQNAVSYMSEKGLLGVQKIAANTDNQALERAKADAKILLGPNVTYGLGTGGDPELGEKAMRESMETVFNYLKDADMVFLTCGLGGGTGTGGIVILAEELKKLDILTVAVVTLPSKEEGSGKTKLAWQYLERLKKLINAIIIVDNSKIKNAYPDLDITEAYMKSNEALYKAVSGIVEIVKRPGTINVDFNDVKRIMQIPGRVVMGIGEGEGEDRGIKAINNGLSDPLLVDTSIRGSKGLLVYLIVGKNFTVNEFEKTMEFLLNEVLEDPNNLDYEFKKGIAQDLSLDNKVRLVILATGVPYPHLDKTAEYPFSHQTQRKTPKKTDSTIISLFSNDLKNPKK